MSHSAYRGASSAILARPPTSVPLLKGSDRDGLGASTSACDQGHALVRRKVSIEEHSPRLCLPPCTVWLGDGVQEMNTTLYNTSTAAELSFRPLFLCVLVREDGYRQGGQKAVWGRVNPTTSLAQTTPSLPLLVGWCCGRSSHPLCTAPAGDAKGNLATVQDALPSRAARRDPGLFGIQGSCGCGPGQQGLEDEGREVSVLGIQMMAGELIVHQ
jgi:hypothetical protein